MIDPNWRFVWRSEKTRRWVLSSPNDLAKEIRRCGLDGTLPFRTEIWVLGAGVTGAPDRVILARRPVPEFTDGFVHETWDVVPMLGEFGDEPSIEALGSLEVSHWVGREAG